MRREEKPKIQITFIIDISTEVCPEGGSIEVNATILLAATTPLPNKEQEKREYLASNSCSQPTPARLQSVFVVEFRIVLDFMSTADKSWFGSPSSSFHDQATSSPLTWQSANGGLSYLCTDRLPTQTVTGLGMVEASVGRSSPNRTGAVSI